MKHHVISTFLIVLFGLLLQCVFFPMDTLASNHVKVVSLGGEPPMADKTLGMQQMVEQVIAHWNIKLSVILPNDPDLIVMAEHCDTPRGLNFEKRKEYTKVRGEQIQDFFASVAIKHHTYIAFGTYLFTEDGKFYNSLMVLDRNGNVAGIYHKNFPTVGEMEKGVSAGVDTPLIQCDFGTVAGVICYDLNFPELRDRYAALHPDIILFSANYHGGYKQRDWAYSCRSFFVGALGVPRPPSEIRNPQGDLVASSGDYLYYAIANINLDRVSAHLDYNWELWNLKKKYGSDVTITVPGSLGSVIITSEHDDISAVEMAEEFHIELLDDYFERSRKARKHNLQKMN